MFRAEGAAATLSDITVVQFWFQCIMKPDTTLRTRLWFQRILELGKTLQRGLMVHCFTEESSLSTLHNFFALLWYGLGSLLLSLKLFTISGEVPQFGFGGSVLIQTKDSTCPVCLSTSRYPLLLKVTRDPSQHFSL
ncbi:hypothetical protein E2C01_024538 [Portunus trituberculatus]|uniref:Uncharacterized protein n=1 Tax=Portunus trituberculatus TaxID=210409 RepID=A0A5B7EF13_PORTR|nr:hypothetical protein [Portunus trituberculatus]